MNDTRHVPVLLEPTVELLAPALDAPGAVMIDATLGLGGHSEALLRRFPELRIIGIDRDTTAIELASQRLAFAGDRVTIVHTTYDDIEGALDAAGVRRVDGVLADLGVSSMQLDEVDRGFSYSRDAPLDMRMDTTSELTAAELVATLSSGELASIFRRYGEEKLAGRYADRIVAARDQSAIETTGQLVELIQAATPAALARKGHPAKRVFQALRIAVNDELSVLADAVPAMLASLRVGGRIVVMSYQSLEDRIVKRELAAAAASTAPAGLPVETEQTAARFRLLTRGAVMADDAERERNPRSTPVRLRAAERIREAT